MGKKKANPKVVNRKVRRNPPACRVAAQARRPLGRGQGARMQIRESTLEVGESRPFKAGFFKLVAYI